MEQHVRKLLAILRACEVIDYWKLKSMLADGTALKVPTVGRKTYEKMCAALKVKPVMLQETEQQRYRSLKRMIKNRRTQIAEMEQELKSLKP